VGPAVGPKKVGRTKAHRTRLLRIPVLGHGRGRRFAKGTGECRPGPPLKRQKSRGTIKRF